MPVTPYSWQIDDFLTATKLNGELYRTLGQYYQANGTGFHGARPVYKSFYPTNNGFTSGAWATVAGGAGAWDVIADSGGYMGERGDGECRGILGLRALLNGGGGPPGGAQDGGLGLVTGNVSLAANGTAAAARAGIGDFTVSGQPPTTGTMQGTNSLHATGPWVLDIMDIGTTDGVSLFAECNGATPKNVTTEIDGSGQACRLHAFWASVYPGNGTTVTSLPTPTASWTGTSPTLSASYMNGLTGIAAVMNLLNMPPLLRATGLGSATSAPDSTGTTCVYGTKTYDTYNGYNTSTHTYTVPLKGLYLVYNCFPYDSINTSAMYAGVVINGTAYFGPGCQGVAGTGNGGAAAKVQIFSLNAGDTITPITYQQSGSTQTGSASYNGIFVVLFLGMQGAPGALPSAPDITYSWLAGTPASSMPGLFNSHFANDLLFLTQRPYFMGYQSTAQTGIAMGTTTAITLQTIQGIVHGDTGDNYSGWNAVNGYYTAPVGGWYLAVMESSMAAPGLTATPSNLVGFSVTNATGVSPYDYYQQANSVLFAGGGAAGVGIYYLRAGDNFLPVLQSFDTSSTTTSTYVGSHNCHLELIWLGE